MIDTIDPKTTDKPDVRCASCDRVVEHYNTFYSPTNQPRVICWQCLAREEKNFFARRGYARDSRTGVIPR